MQAIRTTVFREYAQFEVARLTGLYELDANYSISHSQGDFVAFEGRIDSIELLELLDKLLINDQDISAIEKSEMSSVFRQWVKDLDMLLELSSNRCSQSFDYTQHVELTELFFDSPLEDDLHLAVIQSRIDDCIEYIKHELESINSKIQQQLSEISLNTSGDCDPVKTITTKQFKVEVFEREMDIDDALIFEEYDEYTHKLLIAVSEGKSRAFDLEVKVSMLIDDEFEVLSQANCHGIFEDLNAKKGGSNLRDVCSEAIFDAREKIKTFQKLAA